MISLYIAPNINALHYILYQTTICYKCFSDLPTNDSDIVNASYHCIINIIFWYKRLKSYFFCGIILVKVILNELILGV